MTPAALTLVGATFECQLCLGCNHLYMRGHIARGSGTNALAKREPPKDGAAAPAVESCPLTPEQEEEARRLLGA